MLRILLRVILLMGADNENELLGVMMTQLGTHAHLD